MAQNRAHRSEEYRVPPVSKDEASSKASKQPSLFICPRPAAGTRSSDSQKDGGKGGTALSAYQVLHTQTPLVSGCWELHTEAPPLCLRLGYFLPFSALSRRSCRQPGECLRSPSGGLCRGEASQGQGLGMGGNRRRGVARRAAAGWRGGR